MPLNLDTRQRAMLQEMGVRLWSPLPAATPTPSSKIPQSPQLLQLPQLPQAPKPSKAPQNLHRTAPPPAPALRPPSLSMGAASPLVLYPPEALYPSADPHCIPPGVGHAWLIVTHGEPGAHPFADEAGVLLDNMLRALGLHQHPRVFLSKVAPQPPSTPNGACAPSTAQVLADAVAHVQPDVVLIMGRMAARAALGRTEPLGQLRAQPHTVAGRNAIVTYEAHYLLRAPQSKPAAWADLCHAMALVRGRKPLLG